MAQTVVVKIGSASLACEDGKYLDIGIICRLVETLCKLRRQGHNVVLVTSGAVSIGSMRMGMEKRPTDIITKQAVAAIGQSRLMRTYDDFFDNFKQPVAQILLTRENLNKEHHYKNAHNTMRRLLEMGVIPIVNENDTVSVGELRFGDNDTLSALVASLIDADKLVLLTDVDCLYTANPRTDKTAKKIPLVEDISKLNVSFGDSGKWGTGGMETKVTAARIATAAGVRTIVCSSQQPENLMKLISDQGSEIGTHFLPQTKTVKGLKRWLAHGLAPGGNAKGVGVLVLDQGAVRAIKNKKSLFAVGITKVDGAFQEMSGVALVDESGKEIGRGVANYSSEHIKLIMRQPSDKIPELLGFNGPEEVIHRSNLFVEL